MPAIALLTFLAVQWWAAWYPGAEPGGGGYVAQRIFSARTEKDGVLATLFFNVGHYALRPWPWIVTGLCTVLLYPGGVLVAREDGPRGGVRPGDGRPAARRLEGLHAGRLRRGVHVDRRDAPELGRELPRQRRLQALPEEGRGPRSTTSPSARWTTVFLFLASIVVTLNLSTIEGAWRFLLALGSGTGLVLILRWYWWRINAWSEISAMVSSVVVSLAALLAHVPTPRSRPAAPEFEPQAIVMLVTVAVSTVVWVAVTFLTKPEPDATLDAFYERVRPGGPGWARVSRRLGYGREAIPGGAMSFVNWILGIVLVYSALFGIGKLVFGQLLLGFALVDMAIVAFVLILWNLSRDAAPAVAAHLDGPPPGTAPPSGG